MGKHRLFTLALMKDFIHNFQSDRKSVYARTSGSTGKPKRIRLLKEDMRASAQATNAFFGITANSVLACPLSTDYIAGKMMYVRALCAGCRVISLPVSNNIIIPSGQESIDLLAVVPTQMPSLLHPGSGVKKVRNLLVGGATPDYSICPKVAALGPRVWVSYGMTETCSHIALADASDPQRIYHAMPQVSFSISQRGTLVVHVPHLKIKQVETNDFVELIDAQSFRYLGRADFVINSGGLKLHPESLEQKYAPYLPGLNFYLTSEPDPALGERLVIVVEGTQQTADHALQTLRAAFPDHKHLPRRAHSHPTLPRTPTPKPKRQKLI